MTKPLQVRVKTAPKSLKSSDLTTIFNHCFEDKFNTVLVGGATDPVYLPADTVHPRARVVFTQDYYASALHEIAHWCIAGPQRRLQEDYGYWYAPDGRTIEQQETFERVEVKPQALEWVFSVAAGAPFRVSADNLLSGLGPTEAFIRAIVDQAREYRLSLSGRALTFATALGAFYNTKGSFQQNTYHASLLSL